MKYLRNLSGIRFNNACFEDLPESEKDLVLKPMSRAELKVLCKQLANVITQLGDSYSLMK